jgi:hypothetical protein
MKNDKNVVYLIENGLSAKTVANLSESQIKLLVEKFKKETKEEVKQTVTNVTYDPNNPADQKTLAQKGIHVDPTNKKITMSQGSSGEIKEDETDDVTSSNALGKDAEQSYTGQEAPHDANDMADDGMDDDSSDDRSMMGMAESKLNEKFESKAQQGLFWARCNKCSDKKCKWCKMAKEFSDSTSKKDYKKMPEKKSPEKTNEGSQKYWENKILEMIEEEKKRRKKTPKKESESMIIRKPKKMTMFSNEAPMELPIAKMFSIGKK